MKDSQHYSDDETLTTWSRSYYGNGNVYPSSFCFESVFFFFSKLVS